MNSKLNTYVVADPRKCIGCKVCEVACSVAHSNEPVTTVGTMAAPILSRLYLVKTAEVTMPIQCRHCEDAPCANACAVSAIKQVGGKIIVDEVSCIGCKTCMMACPFGAIDLVPVYKNGEALLQPILKMETDGDIVEKEWLVASKCDLCAKQETGPACIEVCPEKALELIRPKQDKKRRNEEAALNLFDSVKKFIG